MLVAAIAHRFGYALAYTVGAPLAVEVMAHACDYPFCQRPEHWRKSTPGQNRREWAARRHQLSGPLRDLRGAVAVLQPEQDADNRSDSTVQVGPPGVAFKNLGQTYVDVPRDLRPVRKSR